MSISAANDSNLSYAQNYGQSFGHHFKDASLHMPQPEPTGLVGWMRGAIQGVTARLRRARMMHELGALSDHDLADAGLTRAELRLAFDTDFATAWNADRAAARGLAEG